MALARAAASRLFTNARPRFCSSCSTEVPAYLPDVAVTGSDPMKVGVITT